MKKEEVIIAYKNQKAACITAFPTLTSSWTYFVQLEKAIDSYFSNADSVSDSVRAVIRGAYVSQTKSGVKVQSSGWRICRCISAPANKQAGQNRLK